MKNNSKYADLTIDEAIKAILADNGIQGSEDIRKAMDTAFREGWFRGEAYMDDIHSAQRV